MFVSPLHQQYQLQQHSNSSFLSNSQISKKSVESDSPNATNKDVSELSNQIADAANSLDTSSLHNEPIHKDQPLQVDTANVTTDHRPSSRSSNSSGIQLPQMPMGMCNVLLLFT